MLELAVVGAQDEVREIGCGLGLLGLALVPCWGRLSNVCLVRLPSVGLAGFQANSFDVVYSIDVFGHLNEWDRYRDFLVHAPSVFKIRDPSYNLPRIRFSRQEGLAVVALRRIAGGSS